MVVAICPCRKTCSQKLVLSIDNEADSLTLRQESLPVEEAMIESEEFLHLCNRMLATVQNPDNEGVGIAAPQVGIL